MARTLLDLIGINKRNADRSLNIPIPDVRFEGTPFEQFADDFERKAWETNPNVAVQPNIENVLQIAQRFYNDMRSLNLPNNDPVVVESIDYSDVSVIDMPEIEEISESIYRNAIRLNKYVGDGTYQLENIEQAPFATTQITDYLTEVGDINQIRIPTIGEVLVGLRPANATPIGDLGFTALQDNLQRQREFNVLRQTLGKFNFSGARLLAGEPLTVDDFNITRPKSNGGRLITGLADVQGVTIPISPIDEAAFDLENTRALSLRERARLLAEYTGAATVRAMANSVNRNKYRLGLDDERAPIQDKQYTTFGTYTRSGDYKAERPDQFGFVVDADTVGGLYPSVAGVELTYKDGKNINMFSNDSHFTFAEDPYFGDRLEWDDTENIYDPKSLLYKTKELVLNNAPVFIRTTDKEFVTNEAGNLRTISRGDNTTASGDYIDDDQTPIKAGEYFRVWTKQRPYSKLSRTLRHRGLDNKDSRSVLLENGLVNYAPTLQRYRDVNGSPLDALRESNGVYEETIIKRYMFSIENLGWNDFLGDLPICEQGAGDAVTGHRGRIMWFPPYDLVINETVNANWATHDFIGRGESIHTYTNTSRTADLSFTVIVDHPKIVNKLKGQKTQFWERYFKGDKLVEKQALELIKQRLTPDEQTQLEQLRKAFNPIKRKVDTPIVPTPIKIEAEKKEKSKDPNIGNRDLVLSVYYPNLMTLVPPPLTAENATKLINYHRNMGYEDGGTTLDMSSITIPDNVLRYLRAKNLADKGLKKRQNQSGAVSRFSDSPPTTFVNNRLTKYTTTNGIKFTSFNSNPFSNTVNRYDSSTNTWVIEPLKKRQEARTNKRATVCGVYYDDNNYGLNVDYFYNYEKLIREKILLPIIENNKNGKPTKARIYVIGNASGAKPNNGTTNDQLSQARANNARDWFLPKFDEIAKKEMMSNPDVAAEDKNRNPREYFLLEGVINTKDVTFQADLEDQKKQEAAVNAEFDKFVANAGESATNPLLIGTVKNNIRINLNSNLQKEYCAECDDSDTQPCKKTRRADIFVQLYENDPDPTPAPPNNDTTTPNVVDDPTNNPDPDQNIPNPDPDLPEIDPNILSKLIYTECDFFEYLELNDPVAYQTISERIKYFHPAYHSMTPEGYNSRLTFLHQCTRQADSIGGDGIDYVRNLSFGRPPVCILRIGDYYHTRIIINSLSINHAADVAGDMVWDLNPEGIGVQPMAVHITLGITILGGSSMTAPINRLQNALSFNYYANTEMYDARAESVVFKNGLGVDPKTGEIQKGEIVDGIRLSKFVNIDKKKLNENIARIRKESRIANDRQDLQRFPIPTTVPTEINNVPDLLALKVWLQMPLTEEEIKAAEDKKIAQQKANEALSPDGDSPLDGSLTPSSAFGLIRQFNPDGTYTPPQSQ